MQKGSKKTGRNIQREAVKSVTTLCFVSTCTYIEKKEAYREVKFFKRHWDS